MKQFSDTTGNVWAVSVNVGTVKRVKDLLEINLLDIADGGVIDRISADPVLLCDILYVVCKDQADKDGITDVQFGQSMSGDVLDTALDALVGELVDFFPNPRRREILKQAWGKMRDLETKMMDKAEITLDGIEVDQMLEQMLEKQQK